ncbi:hypothetical protein MMC13_000068 [Lambiella insularis]|nr:hypothetical protein [Lambiella insularis]
MASPPLLLFLRPLPLPRPQYIHNFLRGLATTRQVRQANPSLSKPQSSTPLTTEALASPQPAASAATAQTQLTPLSYHVHRTASKQLPVYHDAKRGGNLHQTRIRKIEGSINDLRNELQEALELREEQIVINQLTRHIIIKGWMKAEVDKFLEERRF